MKQMLQFLYIFVSERKVFFRKTNVVVCLYACFFSACIKNFKFKVVLKYSSDAVSLFDSRLYGTRCAEKSVRVAHAAQPTAQCVSHQIWEPE